MSNDATPSAASPHQRLRDRVDQLQEAVDIGLATNDYAAQSLLRGRLQRLEQSVGEIYEAQAMLDQSNRVQALATLKIKRALGDVVSDISELANLAHPAP